MKERILRDYLDNKVTVDILAADLKDSQKQTSYDVVNVFVDPMDEPGEFQISRDHLIRLLDDTIAGQLTTTDLNTIAFALIGSEYFDWDEKDKVLESTIQDLDSPEIGYPLSLENLKRWKVYLQTGEYTFDKRELRREISRAKK